MKRAVERLTALVLSVFALRASRVQQDLGIKSPTSCLLLASLLALTPGYAGVAKADLLDGLQLHVEFEDNVVDSSPNGFDGQANGDLQYAVGVIGQAAMFDGVDDEVLFPTFSDTMLADNDFSIAFWFDLPTGELLSVLGKRETCSVSPFFDIRANSNRALSFEVSDPSSFHTVSSPATTAGWHHVTFTRTGTDLQAFLDGELAQENVTPSTFDFTNMATLGMSNSPCIGSDGTQMLIGGIDELRIYDRRLTDFEIVNLGGIFADGFESGDVSAWSASVP